MMNISVTPSILSMLECVMDKVLTAKSEQVETWVSNHFDPDIHDMQGYAISRNKI